MLTQSATIQKKKKDLKKSKKECRQQQVCSKCHTKEQNFTYVVCTYVPILDILFSDVIVTFGGFIPFNQ